MVYMKQKLHSIGAKAETVAERAMKVHPYLFLCGVFICVPIAVVGAVFGITCAAVLPFSILFGWN